MYAKMIYALARYTQKVNGVTQTEEVLSTVFPNYFNITNNTTINLLSPGVIYNNENIYHRTSTGTQTLISATLDFLRDSAGNNIPIINSTATLPVSGIYQIRYTINYSRTVAATTNIYDTSITYTFNALENRLPLKKWTITDCINRCLDLAEPLQVTNSTTGTDGSLTILAQEMPRFKFDGVQYDENGKRLSTYITGSQAEKYDKVLAPEFSMTKATLREQLQQIGGYIHAEPRLKNGVIYFVEYGGNKFAQIKKKHYISHTVSQGVNQYCTALDTTADNLINRLDYAQGVIVEPFSGGYKTQRCEVTTVQVADNDAAFIATQRPIMDIVKLEASAPISDTEWTPFVDITATVFEQADYENLSSYDGIFPYAKAYGLYYTQGEKNIRGLFFKNPNAVNTIFSKYAIVNIFTLYGYNIQTSRESISLYPTIRFRVSYIPKYSARIRTNKSVVVNSVPRTLAYNQGSNQIETRYYGEHLKGVVARLGNVEKSYTYKVAFLTYVPVIGELFDNDYYISTYAVEYYPTYLKITIGLSKDFNRLSEYIGISSNLRMWEVSEKQAYSRDSVYSNYCLVTDDHTAVGADLLLQPPGRIMALAPLVGNRMPYSPMKATEAIVYGLTKQGKRVNGYAINLPVVSSALGDTITLSFNFEDNYSAGQKVSTPAQNGSKSYFSEYVPYNDFYGRFYYLNFFIKEQPSATESWSGFELPQQVQPDITYPLVGTVKEENFTNTIQTPIIYRKTGTEIPAISVQLQFVTDNAEYVIGSGWARSCPLVNGIKPVTPKIYILPNRLPKFEQKVDITGLTGIDVPQYQNKGGNLTFDFKTTITANASGKAWAIVTPSNIVSEQVEDEDGNEVTQSVETGCELILGKNVEISEGAEITLPRLVFKNKLYK